MRTTSSPLTFGCHAQGTSVFSLVALNHNALAGSQASDTKALSEECQRKDAGQGINLYCGLSHTMCTSTDVPARLP